MKRVLTGIMISVGVISIIANILMYFKYSSSRPLVTLGTDRITRKEYQDAIDYSYGPAVLKKLVFSKLVNDAAARSGVRPTDADIDARLADMRRRDPQSVPDAAVDPVAAAQFRKDLTAGMALENLRIAGIPVTEAEIRDYYKGHLADFRLPTRLDTTIVVTTTPLDAQVAEADLKQGLPNDVMARNGLQVVGVNGCKINMAALPTDTRQRIETKMLKMPAGSVYTTRADSVNLTIRVDKNQPATMPDLAQVHDEVARLVRLQKSPSPSVELAELYKDIRPTFSVDKYHGYFLDVEQSNANRVAEAPK